MAFIFQEKDYPVLIEEGHPGVDSLVPGIGYDSLEMLLPSLTTPSRVSRVLSAPRDSLLPRRRTHMLVESPSTSLLLEPALSQRPLATAQHVGVTRNEAG